MKYKLLSYFSKRKTHIYLFLILILGIYFRLFNVNWDNNYYFQPDERAIIMFATQIFLPASFSDFLSPQSTLNPHFFAYGTFPIYLLRILSTFFANFNPTLNAYGGMHLVGRVISALFDTGTILIVFLLGKKLFSEKTGLLAAFFYSASALSIQLSHFFAVDTILTFFLTATILIFINFITHPTKKLAVLFGATIGLAIATKISALIIIPILIFPTMLMLYKNRKKKIFIYFFPITIAILTALAFSIISQPYIIIDWNEFIAQTSLQSQMSKNPYLFPYTLQYVNKTPFIYELKNIFFWGLGPIITILSLAGIVALFSKYISNNSNKKILIVLLYVSVYFIVFGSFAVGYMRYMLPIYPFLALTAGFFAVQYVFSFSNKIFRKNTTKKILLIFFVFLCLIYPLSFLSIYTRQNTRIQATNWIIKNIPIGSTIATEHWDDNLPLENSHNYSSVQLPLYETDTPQKWADIERQLLNTDYIIIASHRLYIPLQGLTNCKKIKEGYCYPYTANYYKKLFNDELDFRKVAEFSSLPKIPFFPIYINDFSADENFTVFDHPKVIIFKKTK